MDWLSELVAHNTSGLGFMLNEPAAKSTLTRSWPDELKRFLSTHDGAILFHADEHEWTGLHLFGSAKVTAETGRFRDEFGHGMKGLLVIGKTPGAGAYYLAMDKSGQIIDMTGSPYIARERPSLFPYFRGDWKVIAGSLESLVTRMFEAKGDPFYWFHDQP